MIKAIIVEDEQHCVDRVKTLVVPFADTIEVIAVFKDVESAIEGIQRLQPNLLFLDVQIHDQTGFDVLRAIENPQFEVIFTTAFDRYAVQAFKFSAVDYLLKPIDADDFEMAMTKVSQKLKAKDFSNKVEVLLSNISKKDPHKKISIATVDGYSFVEVAEIVRCEAAINYTTIHLTNHQKITVSKTLKTFEELLSDCNFFRVHNSHLINLACIKKYTKGKGGYITMSDNTDIEVSTRRKDALLKLIVTK